MPQANLRHQAAALPQEPAHSSRRQSEERLRQVSRELPRSKVRWDRKFRMIMLSVVVVVGWVGVHAGIDLLKVHNESQSEMRLVSQLAASNRRLEAHVKELNQRSTIIQAARGLGMVKAGEHSYVVVKQH